MEKLVLVAPMNWGLGHATRCIPIINALRDAGAQVEIASDGVAGKLLQRELPELPFHELPSYDMHYKSTDMTWNFATQSVKMLRAMRGEQLWLRKYVAERKPYAVVTDNRYGLYHKDIKSILVSHQMMMISPYKIFQPLADSLIKYYHSRFDELWVPDVPNEPSLSGKLGHQPMYQPRYLGVLTRFKHLDPAPPKVYDYMVMLSGPEPQRTKLEEELLPQVKALGHLKCLFVRGLPQKDEREQVTPNLEIRSFMRGDELSLAMQSSKVLVSRSGYSTVLDLARIGTKAIFIPTPGQTEQEYLAEQFEEKGIYLHQTQGKTNLALALDNYDKYTALDYGNDDSLLRSAIASLLEI